VTINVCGCVDNDGNFILEASRIIVSPHPGIVPTHAHSQIGLVEHIACYDRQ